MSIIGHDSVVRLENDGPTTENLVTETTWINRFQRYDRILSGSLLHLCYRLIDILLLTIGLWSSRETCSWSNRFAVTSICILIFYLIDLAIICQHFFNLSRHASEEENAEQLRRVSALRGFFIFLKLIPVCFGMSYVFASSGTTTTTTGCEILRFCLGLVCFSTFLIMIIPPTKPDLPVRRSFWLEFGIFAFLAVINGIYFGTVGAAIKNVNDSSCVYEKVEDFYLGAPLKSYARWGLIIYSILLGIHLFNLIITQLCYRLSNGRRFIIDYYAFQYALTYFSGIVLLYYLSLGALFLFQPRSGGFCHQKSPTLFRTLIIWQWLRILAPLLAVPLILILCCLGVFFGIILSYCLPASITVPILELLRGWLSAAPVQLNPNPPATRESIDALPVVLFGQESDKFNQTECAICQTNFEANEPLKKLQCGHLFHSACVANWLVITRICPICRQRMSVTS